jgi:response regulator RpfG family c-di-GMP phosphodiesterase
LITGYPSIETAIRALNLAVFDYVLKPFVLEQLVTKVRAAAARGKMLRTIRRTKESLEVSAQSLSNQLAELSQTGPSAFRTEVDSYVAMAQRNVLSSLSDMYSIVKAATGAKDPKETLTVLDCPPLREHRRLLEETVQVLEKTRSAFKSKDLAILRQKTEKFLAEGSS